MPGKIILAGGNEMRPGCEEMDERVLQEAGGAAARVVFLPTAVARHDPRGSGRGAVAYWGRLGARCDVAMILDRAGADRQEWVEMIEGGTLIYLGGGDPDVLLDALADSSAWQAILRVYARGGVVGGSSAGAMVVCARTLLPGKRDGASPPWVDGLGLIPVPHGPCGGHPRA
jgi:cyanophycinase